MFVILNNGTYLSVNKKDFNFDLPVHLIAQYPLAERSDSRLLVYDISTGQHSHQHFNALAQMLSPGDLLVMNDSQVIPARLYGNKSTGGHVELLVERCLDNDTFWAHIKASKAPRAGACIKLDRGWSIEVLDKQEDLYYCQAHGSLDTLLHDIGHIPLPKYIDRANETLDLNRYQTVYARHKGSVAAPTAGLHFDAKVLERLRERQVNIAYVTLHVGAGTFRPVRTEKISDHKMHFERFTVTAELCAAVQATHAAGKRVIAVGTTALRALESAALVGELQACSGNTDIFIVPGYKFRVCDGLISNFHLPESTLLMLVSALIGHKNTMDLYKVAIENQYRFFSYGDACLFI